MDIYSSEASVDKVFSLNKEPNPTFWLPEI